MNEHCRGGQANKGERIEQINNKKAERLQICEDVRPQET